MAVDIIAYFAQSDSPAAGSPVGNLLVKVLAKYPDLSLEAARAEVLRLLDKAAGKFHLSTPQVLSVEQRNAAKARFQSLTASRNALDTPAMAFPTPTSVTQPSELGAGAPRGLKRLTVGLSSAFRCI
jgi:hypothetical protein